MKRFDRRFRVLLKSPKLKDRAFVRETPRETGEFFRGLRLERGEKAFLQVYLDGLWVTKAFRGNVKEDAA